MDCRSKRDFNLDDDEDLGDDHDHDEDLGDDDHSRLMDFRPKQDFNFNFLPTALESVNLSICLSLGESDNFSGVG